MEGGISVQLFIPLHVKEEIFLYLCKYHIVLKVFAVSVLRRFQNLTEQGFGLI